MNKSSQRSLALSQSKGSIAIILLFLVALIAVGAGAYFYGKGGLKLPATKQPATPGAQVSATPTAQQPSNIKTYSSETYGYSVSYPNDWETYSYAHTPTKDTDGSPRFFRQKGTNSAEVNIEVGDGADGLTLDSFASTIKGYSWEDKRVENITLSGVPAVKVSGAQNGKTNIAVAAINGKHTYSLQTLGDNADIFSQMIATFKFTN